MSLLLRYVLVFLTVLGCAELRARDMVLAAAERPHMARDMAETILTEAYRRLGWSLRLEHLPLERGLLQANSGVLDGELMRTAHGQSSTDNLLSVGIPVAEDDFVAYGKGAVLKVSGMASLKPWRLASIRGIKELENLGPEYRVHFVASADQLFGMLDKGRVDLVILTRGAACLPRQLGFTGIEIQESALSTLQFFHHLHMRHKTLVPQLETTLRQMQTDGTYQRLREAVRKKWLTCSD